MAIYASIGLQVSVFATLQCLLVKIASACGLQSIVYFSCIKSTNRPPLKRR